MTNPFEDDSAMYLALVNHEGQYSLWPEFAEVPPGWTIAHERDTREASLAFIDAAWTDMRPLSLIREMEGTAE